MSFAPIALFGYNRPEHLEETIDALSSNHDANKYDLYIFLDGPKSPFDVNKVKEVFAVAEKACGFRKVTISQMKKNQGLSASIIGGVSQLCRESGRVIVLEDDLITSKYFLEFMNNALNLYENDTNVAQVSGYMFNVELSIEDDACFFPITNSWGWGTWERAWKNYDVDMTGYDKIVNNKTKIREFNLDGGFDYLTMLKKQKAGEIDSWAIRWYLTVFNRRELVVYPKKSLVRNIGFDGTGRHCDTSSEYSVELESNYRPHKMPLKVEKCREFKKVKKWFQRKKSIRKWFFGKLRKY